MLEERMSYETILLARDDAVHPRVAVITLNRPQALNAISKQLLRELADAVTVCDRDPGVGAIVITGGPTVFAAGADIGEMRGVQFSDALLGDAPDGRAAYWRQFNATRKPIIGAVAGYALGAGCELSMACDILLCDNTAKFGQPEIKLATIPGAGGTQRLSRYIGKSRAMEMCLTGSMLSADEAQHYGLVSRVVPADELMPQALKMAQKIASHSLPAVVLAKEAVNAAWETTLSEGLRFERRSFLATYATEDRAEGVSAFTEKRPARFKHR